MIYERIGTGGASRAQAAVELLAYSSFFLIVLVGAVAIFFNLQSQEAERAQNAYAQEIAYGFADHVRTALIAGNGFSEEFYLSSDILGKPYRILLSSATSPSSRETGLVYVVWAGPSGYEASLSAPTVTAAYLPVTDAHFIKLDHDFIVINPSVWQKVRMGNSAGNITISKAP